MARFRVDQYETYISSYIVEAENEIEAVAKVYDGDDVEPLGSPEFIEVNNEFGMSLEAAPEGIKEKLYELGWPISDDILDSIASIHRLKG